MLQSKFLNAMGLSVSTKESTYAVTGSTLALAESASSSGRPRKVCAARDPNNRREEAAFMAGCKILVLLAGNMWKMAIPWVVGMLGKGRREVW
jgi:hypothetical protein